MKYSLILLFSFFFPLAFANPCADLESAYRNSVSHHDEVMREAREAQKKAGEAADLYTDAFVSLAETVESRQVSTDLSYEREQTRQIAVRCDAVEHTFTNWKAFFDEKDRLRGEVIKARETLTNTENALLQCHDQNKPQE